MKKIFGVMIFLFSVSAIAQSEYQLNRTFSSSRGHVQENPGSFGNLSLSSDFLTVTRSVTTCFNSGMCGPEITSNHTFNGVKEDTVLLVNQSNGNSENERILLSTNDRLIVIRTILFTDTFYVQDWVTTLFINTPVSSNYALDKLLIMGGGIILTGHGSTGSLNISSDGNIVTRNIMICSSLDGCGFPTQIDFNVTSVPGNKVFLQDRSTGSVIENTVIAATGEVIILLEKAQSGDVLITRWVKN